MSSASQPPLDWVVSAFPEPPDDVDPKGMMICLLRPHRALLSQFERVEVHRVAFDRGGIAVVHNRGFKHVFCGYLRVARAAAHIINTLEAERFDADEDRWQVGAYPFGDNYNAESKNYGGVAVTICKGDLARPYARIAFVRERGDGKGTFEDRLREAVDDAQKKVGGVNAELDRAARVARSASALDAALVREPMTAELV